MFEQRICVSCSGPIGVGKRLGAQYCSLECRRAAEAVAKRHERYSRAVHRRAQIDAAQCQYKVWLFGFQQELLKQAPRSAIGYQLGAPVALGALFWFPHSVGKARRRTVAGSWAKNPKHFGLSPFEQPWVPKAGFYRLRYVLCRGNDRRNYPPVRIPYSLPLDDLAFDAEALLTEEP